MIAQSVVHGLMPQWYRNEEHDTQRDGQDEQHAEQRTVRV